MPLAQTIEPILKDLGGGFMVRRLLPAASPRAVGPFVFFDHFGPFTTRPGDDHDVRPHPHIGLSTVTYLFEGAMMHRDSLGKVQRIEPGAINWMTAGKGIVHSERAPEDLRGTTYEMHGLQLWCALPAAFEETEPSFVHTPASLIPTISGAGFAVRVLIGEMVGVTSPVKPKSPTLYVEVKSEAGHALSLPSSEWERAIYVIGDDVRIDGSILPQNRLGVLTGDAARITALTGSHYVLIGGEPLGHRHMFWNFVSSRRDLIEAAKAAWRAQQMGRIPGESEFIPLP